VAIPIGPQGWPDGEQRASGTAVDISPREFSLEFAFFPDVSALIVGMAGASGQLHYAGIEVESRFALAPGRVRVLGRLGGIGHELLQPRNLVPRFQLESMSFSRGFPEEVLARWAELGVLQAVALGRLLLCPQCLGLPAFRKGCSHCGSARIVSRHSGVSSCPDCHATEAEEAYVGQCFRCEYRFPDHQAVQMELKGYQARRLDPATFCQDIRSG